MKIVALASRIASGRSTVAPRAMRGWKFANIFAYGDGSVERIHDLASAAYRIRKSHPRGADFILIGMAQIQGMKVSQDSWGLVTVLIGLRPATLEMSTVDNEVLVAFDHGALRPAGVIGFLWEDGSGSDSGPPESNSASESRLHGYRSLRRLKST